MPSHEGLRTEEFQPEVILFVRNIRAKQKEIEPGDNELKYKPWAQNRTNLEFKLFYFFWDNRAGKAMAYNTINKELRGGESGPSDDAIRRFAKECAE